MRQKGWGGLPMNLVGQLERNVSKRCFRWGAPRDHATDLLCPAVVGLLRKRATQGWGDRSLWRNIVYVPGPGSALGHLDPAHLPTVGQ